MLFEVLILLFCLYLVIRGPSSLSLHTSGGTGTVPGESFSLDCPGFPAALKLDKKKKQPSNTTKTKQYSIMYYNNKTIAVFN